jgi:hypothetical protein
MIPKSQIPKSTPIYLSINIPNPNNPKIRETRAGLETKGNFIFTLRFEGTDGEGKALRVSFPGKKRCIAPRYVATVLLVKA